MCTHTHKNIDTHKLHEKDYKINYIGNVKWLSPLSVGHRSLLISWCSIYTKLLLCDVWHFCKVTKTKAKKKKKSHPRGCATEQASWIPPLVKIERLLESVMPVWSQWNPAMAHFVMDTQNALLELGVATHSCSPSTQEAKSGGPRVWGQPAYVVRPGLKEQTNPIVSCRYITSYVSLISDPWVHYRFLLSFRIDAVN